MTGLSEYSWQLVVLFLGVIFRAVVMPWARSLKQDTVNRTKQQVENVVEFAILLAEAEIIKPAIQADGELLEEDYIAALSLVLQKVEVLVGKGHESYVSELVELKLNQLKERGRIDRASYRKDPRMMN